eukprot:scaffold46402_cov33-Phaeocystis_antarctica.AAC.2
MKKPRRAGHTAWSLLSSRATCLSLVSMARPGREEIARQVGSRGQGWRWDFLGPAWSSSRWTGCSRFAVFAFKEPTLRPHTL